MAKINKWDSILSSTGDRLKGSLKKQKEQDPFDIFPEWAESDYALEKDKKTNKEKDGLTTGVDNYLARKKAHKKRTSVDFNDDNYVIKTPFSAPPTEQETNAPTNMGEYADLEENGVSYNDPVISTKPTPTSEKLGLPRPGPSSFIQTAKYNPLTKQLNIAYTDGKIFPYHDVSPEMADMILKKKNYHSPGQTLLDTIFYGHGTTKGDEISSLDEGM